jgi:SAM-dependent methyltransferase
MLNARDGKLERELYAQRFDAGERAMKSDIWRVLCRSFFQRYVARDDTVLDLGAGYCEFINNIECKTKLAVDLNEETQDYAAPGVKVVLTPLTDLSPITDASVDVAFASNVFEHLHDKATLLESLREAHRVLRPGGRLLVLGPNIRYAFSEYWDFFDHHLALSHVSLSEALGLAGFRVCEVRPRLLPFSTKSSLPKAAWLVRLYLALPVAHRFLGKQFFVVAEKPSTLRSLPD